jgi:hypothetical protein
MSVDKVDWERVSALFHTWNINTEHWAVGAADELMKMIPAIELEREALVAENERLLDGINAICACLYRAEGLAPKDMADLRIEIKEAIHRARRAYKFGAALKEQSHDG